MNPTLATLLTISVSVIAPILVMVLIFLIPVLLQVRQTTHEAENLIDSVRLQVAPVSRDVGLISRDVKSIVQSIHRQVDRVEDGKTMSFGESKPEASNKTAEGRTENRRVDLIIVK